jgi:nuclear pore complex protein Nup85
MLYTALSFFIALYLPEDGVEDVPVGDELLEWLNIHFIEPSTEDGDLLGSLQNPWEDELFWPYILRYFAHSSGENAGTHFSLDQRFDVW